MIAEADTFSCHPPATTIFRIINQTCTSTRLLPIRSGDGGDGGPGGSDAGASGVTEEICDDAVDNDGDGLTDCDDAADCACHQDSPDPCGRCRCAAAMSSRTPPWAACTGSTCTAAARSGTTPGPASRGYPTSTSTTTASTRAARARTPRWPWCSGSTGPPARPRTPSRATTAPARPSRSQASSRCSTPRRAASGFRCATGAPPGAACSRCATCWPGESRCPHPADHGHWGRLRHHARDGRGAGRRARRLHARTPSCAGRGHSTTRVRKASAPGRSLSAHLPDPWHPAMRGAFTCQASRHQGTAMIFSSMRRVCFPV